MADSWKELRIDDVADIIGGGTPSTKDEENFNGDIPWVTPKDLSDYPYRYISRGERNISKKGLANSSARLMPKNTVLLTTRAPVGYVAIASNPIATNQGFRSLIVHEGFSHEFVFYLLKFNTENLKSHATGTTFAELSGSTLKRMRFLFPPLSEQHVIAHILGSLDDKIELNRKMNETLESMAKAIFKSWFVDFGPVRAKAEGRDPGLPKEIADLFPAEFEDSALGEIPKGWSVKSLSEVTKVITKGTTPTKKDVDVAPHADAQINYVRVNAIEEDGTILLNKLTTIPESVHLGVLKRSVLFENDVLYTIAGTIGRISVVKASMLPANTNQAVAIIRPQPMIPADYLVFTMRQAAFREELHSNIVHAVQANLSLGMLSRAKAVFPPEATMVQLFKPIENIASQMDLNCDESATLTSIRDALLPKLISGEIRIKNAEELVKSVA